MSKHNGTLVRTYSEMARIVRDFARGGIPVLLVIGPPGRGKSEIIDRNIDPKKSHIIRNHASNMALYQQLYEYRNKIIVIDDVDDISKKTADVSLLKCACDTKPVKEIQFNTNHKAIGYGEGQTPPRFQTTSPVCLIVNDWNSVHPNVRALNTRMTMLVDFDPTPEEIHAFVGTWFDDKEVYQFIGDNLDAIADLNIRHYVNGKVLRGNNNPRWRVYLADQMGMSDSLRAFNEIRCDPALRTVKEKVAEFMRRGLGVRSTYFEWVKKFPPPPESPSLQPQPPKRPRSGGSADYQQIFADPQGPDLVGAKTDAGGAQ